MTNMLRNKVRKFTVLTIIGIAIIIVGTKVVGPKIIWYVTSPEQASNRSIAFTKLFDGWYSIPSLFTPEAFPRYQIIVGPSEARKIMENLPDPQTGFMLTKVNKVKVPAYLIVDGSTRNIFLSVRGEQASHWRDTKKSWRIELADDLINGNGQIDFILPSERGYITESASFMLAQYLDIPAPQFSYNNITLNGYNFGLYFTTPTLGTPFLKKNNFPPDSRIYGEQRSGVTTGPSLWSKEGQWKSYNTDFRGKDEYSPLDALKTIVSLPKDEDFFKKLPTIVEVDALLRWQAHAAIFGDFHQDDVHNIRLIFRSDTKKFIIIPNDVGISPLSSSTAITTKSSLGLRVLKNPQWFAMRQKIVCDFVTSSQAVTWQQEISQLAKKVGHDLYKTPTGYKPVSNYQYTQDVSEQITTIHRNLGVLKSGCH